MFSIQKMLLLPFVFVNFLTFSQSSIPLEQQFDEVYKQSGNYQEYKVIKKTSFNVLKQNTLDSINSIKNKRLALQQKLDAQNQELSELKANLAAVNQNFKDAEKRENSINILGISTTKTLYNLIVWLVILILVLLLVFYIYKFNNSNLVTRQTKNKIDEVEKEYEEFRHRSLEREQQLNRKLLDEKKKTKNL